jgi:hypothetical protein
MSLSLIASFIFFLCIGLEYLNVNFKYQRIIIGVAAIVVAVLLVLHL